MLTTGLEDIFMVTKVLAFSLLLLIATCIDATSFAPVTLETVAKNANYVIEGKIVQKTENDDGTYTTDIIVETIHKGNLDFKKITITPFNVFDVGQSYLVFMNKNTSSKYKDEFNIVNGGLGYFQMDNCLVIVAKQASGLLDIEEGDMYGLNDFLLKADIR